MAVVTGFAWWRIDRCTGSSPAPAAAGTPEPGPQSIAILPLVDLSAAGGNSWLGDGLSEELSTRLAQVPGLRVAARTSAFEFKGKNVDVRRIGQSLGVRHVLEGSVRRDGGEVRVTVQLIDARTGYHVWAGNFDRAWRDVLALQDDIARSVHGCVTGRARRTGRQSAPAPSRRLDARALDPYLEGLALLRQPGDAERAAAQAKMRFGRRSRSRPSFAAAHAGLCRALSRRFDVTRDPGDARRSRAGLPAGAGARRHAGRYGEGAGGLVRLGRQVQPRRSTSIAGSSRAIPGDADAQLGLGQALEGLGRETEAEQSLREGRRDRAGVLGGTHGARAVPVPAGPAAKRSRRSGSVPNSPLRAPRRGATSAARLQMQGRS